MTKINEKFMQIIKERRIKLRISVKKLAKKLTISENLLFLLEKGVRSPDLITIIKLCNILKCHILIGSNKLIFIVGVQYHEIITKDV